MLHQYVWVPHLYLSDRSVYWWRGSSTCMQSHRTIPVTLANTSPCFQERPSYYCNKLQFYTFLNHYPSQTGTEQYRNLSPMFELQSRMKPLLMLRHKGFVSWRYFQENTRMNIIYYWFKWVISIFLKWLNYVVCSNGLREFYKLWQK